MSEPSAPGANVAHPSDFVIAEQTAYFNGFSVALGAGDILITLIRNGVPLITLNVSSVVAKSLGLALGGTVSALDEVTSQKTLDMNEFTAAAKAQGKL